LNDKFDEIAVCVHQNRYEEVPLKAQTNNQKLHTLKQLLFSVTNKINPFPGIRFLTEKKYKQTVASNQRTFRSLLTSN
jgi:hypothetical protein